MQRLATLFMMFQLPCWELASTYRDARADVKVARAIVFESKDAEACCGDGMEGPGRPKAEALGHQPLVLAAFSQS
jgi:hypothetical protein